MKTSFIHMGLLMAALFAPGCENAATRNTIQVTPQSAEIAVRSAVTLVASIPEGERDTQQLYYPLVWRVSNPNLGSLQQTVGNTAVYVASGSKGVNTVTVQDQLGAEGVAAIMQHAIE